MTGTRQVRQRPRRPRGFTLIEAALVTCIIGFGVVSMLQLLAAGTVSNTEATELTIGNSLLTNVRELTAGLAFRDPSIPKGALLPYHFGPETGETLATYNDVDDFNGRTFQPPIDARKLTIPNMEKWAQVVTVQNVDPNCITLPVPSGTTKLVRITVLITHNGRGICQGSWIVVDTNSF